VFDRLIESNLSLNASVARLVKHLYLFASFFASFVIADLVLHHPKVTAMHFLIGASLVIGDRGVWLGLPGYARSPFDRSALVCDRLGRCWRRDLDDRFDDGDFGRRHAEPPGWAERLPGSARDDDRFLRPRSNLVCDRATRICYKDGEVDKSDTQSVFGERAGDRADDLRDSHGTARLFVPERGVSCDRERRRCFEDGDPDREATRRYFGRRAARNLD
jgi:hypothetical protein